MFNTHLLLNPIIPLGQTHGLRTAHHRVSGPRRTDGGLTLVAFFVDFTVLFYSGPPVAGAKAAGVVLQLWPPLVLYAVPGLILLLCARFVRRGRPAAAAIIFLIGVLSLFKLAVLPISPEGSVFDAPLYLELPIRGLCAY